MSGPKFPFHEFPEPMVTDDGHLLVGRTGASGTDKYTWYNDNTGQNVTAGYQIVYMLGDATAAPCDVRQWTTFKPMAYADRCQLIHGYVQDAPCGKNFNAALSVLVAHFVKREERLAFFQSMSDRLKKGGYLINTEISFDLNSAEFPSMLKQWEQIQALMGGTPESLASLPQVLREVLTVLPPAETEDILRRCGISMPVRFFQAFMITGWYGKA